MKYIFCSICLFLISVSCLADKSAPNISKNVSPYDLGLAKAKTGVERYEVLRQAHRAAVKAGVNVDYTGIDTLRIEIPPKSSYILLTQYNDFKKCVFIVKNSAKNCWLFFKKKKENSVIVSKRTIDKGDFREVDLLK